MVGMITRIIGNNSPAKLDQSVRDNENSPDDKTYLFTAEIEALPPAKPPIITEEQKEEDRLHLKAMRKSIAKLLEEHKDLLDCLIYIGKADGKMSDKEVEVIAEICNDLSEYKKIPIYRWDTIFRMEIKRPKIEEFEAAVIKVKMKGEREMRLLTTGAERIIHTQKTLSPGEAYCVEVVNRVFAN